jgi:polar amino acid transport system substrate-binding protein
MLSSAHESARTKTGKLPGFLLMVAALLSLVLSACGGGSATSSTPASVTEAPVKPDITIPKDKLVTAGTLTVGSDTTYVPMEYFDNQKNDYTGFDIELVRAMGKHMGLNVKIQKLNFDTILEDLRNKRVDIVISSLTVSPARQKLYDFVNYFNAGESLLVQKGNPKNLKSVADLCGLDVGVQTGTVEKDDLDKASKDCTAKGKQAIKQTILQSQQDVIQLLANNRVVATYQDSPVTDYYNKINPGQFEVGGSVVNAAPYGIAVRKSDKEISDGVQKALQEVKSSGTYDKLFSAYGFPATAKA